MTRLEAIKTVRSGQGVHVSFTPETHGVTQSLLIRVVHVKDCDFRRERQEEHERIGPIHAMFWSISVPFWLHLYPKQLLGFIRRNFPRK